jgi:hypothetical protein
MQHKVWPWSRQLQVSSIHNVIESTDYKANNILYGGYSAAGDIGA